MIASYKKQSKQALYGFLFALGFICLIMATQGRNALVSVLAVVGGISFFWSCWALAKAKGRSGWWLLAPIIANWLGAVIILCLKDKAPDDARSNETVKPGQEHLPEWARAK